MTIRHLKVFIKVCECGNSISRACEELCVAQPSVSQTIKELEEYYSVVIFNRIGKKLFLTDEGNILLTKAKETVREFDEFEKLASNKELNPIVRIGCTQSFGVFIIPKFKKLLNSNYPNIKPLFYVETPSGLEEKILKGDIDFGFEEGLINEKDITDIHIGDDEIIAICSPDYPIQGKIKFENLKDYPLLVREKDNPSRKILDYHFALKGIKINSYLMESVSNTSILSMTSEGEGIGIVPAAVARKQIQDGKIRKIDLNISLPRKLFLVTHKNKVMNSNVLKAYNLGKQILDIVKKEREEQNKKA